ncbi:MAG TPA: lamin tail domain-containing protein [Flavisolibacter sp.]|nr:lamin tail domain-containing protein [Flavisolibacter sp.]
MSPAKLLLAALATAMVCPVAAQTARRFDLLITEIMADPTPAVGLPNAEYIEIKNVSATAYNLQGWRISDATGSATINTAFVLQPDSAVILCANSNVAQFSLLGRTIGVASFPSLDNDGEILSLRSPQNNLIHAVQYSSEWYDNVAKREGGWSLEMVDVTNPCTGHENWKASTSSTGGTPGQPNSVRGNNTDVKPPQVKKAYVLSSDQIVLLFDEPLDSISASVTANFAVQGVTVVAATPLPPLFQQVQLQLHTALQPEQVYSVVVNHLTDCKGNQIGGFNTTNVGLPQPAEAADLVINEILFNPVPGASDYVELYNRSKKIIDASALYIANRNSNGVAASLRKLSEEPFYIFPGDFIVATEDRTGLAKAYHVKNREAVLQLSSLPSFPDDKGNVVLLSSTGSVLDEVAYHKDWHFALINEPEGVSLERIDPAAPSQNRNNWHSAAATAGYGTPGYQNSQYRTPETVNAAITVSPAVFSPDGDGLDDVATIHYQLAEPGYVANVSIFDAAGRLVRLLVKNDLLSLKGFWKWDGIGERQNKLPIGTYIIFTEIFNLEGKKKSFKNTTVLARRLN